MQVYWYAGMRMCEYIMRIYEFYANTANDLGAENYNLESGFWQWEIQKSIFKSQKLKLKFKGFGMFSICC